MKNVPTGKPRKYAIEVIPLIPLPLLRDASFTYEFPESIEEGSLVRIPFGTRSIRGVVSAVSEMKTPLAFKTKPISAIEQASALTPAQIQLARSIGETYFTPLGIVLKHFIAKQVIERKKKTGKSEVLIPLPKLSASQKKLLLPLMTERRSHILTGSPEEKTRLLLAIAKKTMTQKRRQVLILVPDILLAREYFEAFEKYFQRECLALITSYVSGGAYYTSWEGVRDGRAHIIIGTRQALFAPFQGLSTIIMDFDGHDGYKQWDMMPRYEGRVVAEKLALLHEARFITVSPIPTLQTLFKREQSGISIHGQSIFDNRQTRKSVILSDLKLDRYKKNFSPFSILTIEHIRETMRQGRQILIIVNRQGTSIFSVCERCKEVLRCPQCERALIGTNAGSYRCLHCSYHTKEFPSCPNCGGLNFKNMGFGTEKLERDLQRLFAHTRIRRLDAASRRLKKNDSDILRDAQAGKIDILIGTEAALLAPSLPKLDLIALLDGDNALRFPDYQAEERLLRTLSFALSRIADTTDTGKLIIQTFHSEHALFRALSEGTIDSILDTLREDRKLFSYPPFGTVIKCAFQDADEKKVEKEMLRAIQLLETTTGRKSHTWNVSAPVIPLTPKIRGKYVRFLIIRIPGLILPPNLHEILATLSSQGFTIDRNPLSLS